MFKICIFCKKENLCPNSIEHIIPESLGGNVTLPIGLVCDKCNNYFGRTLDNSIQEYHFIGLLKPLLVHKTKKRKSPQFKTYDFSILPLPNENMIALKAGNGNVIHDEKKHTVTFEFRRLFPDLQHVSRAIHKIMFELFCIEFGLQEILKSKYDQIRKYIRNPKMDEYWNFARKNSPMGDEPFEYSFETNYSNQCCMLRIFDVEFIAEMNNKLPIRELSTYEIIDREAYNNIKEERKKPINEWKKEYIIIKYRPISEK